MEKMNQENENNDVQASKPAALSFVLGLAVALGLLGVTVVLWLAKTLLKVLPLAIVVVVLWKYVL